MSLKLEKTSSASKYNDDGSPASCRKASGWPLDMRCSSGASRLQAAKNVNPAVALFENVEFYLVATGCCQRWCKKSAVECLNSRQTFVWVGFVIFNFPSKKNCAQSKARVRLLRWPNVFARSKNPKADCSSGVGGVCAWVPRNGMGGQPAA